MEDISTNDIVISPTLNNLNGNLNHEKIVIGSFNPQYHNKDIILPLFFMTYLRHSVQELDQHVKFEEGLNNHIEEKREEKKRSQVWKSLEGILKNKKYHEYLRYSIALELLKKKFIY